MPTFSGIVTDYENKPKSFKFKVAGVKYTFIGNNIHNIKNGDGVTGAYVVTPYTTDAGENRPWNKVVEISQSSTALANAQQPVAQTGTTAANLSTPAKKDGYRGFGQPGGFPVAPDSYERCTLRRDCVRDAVAALVGKGDKPEPSAVITYAKELEAYVSGTLEVAKAKSAIEKLTETEED